MTKMSKRTLGIALGLAMSLSVPALPSDSVRLECSLNSKQVLLGEPLSANILLRMVDIKSAAVLATSRSFLAVALSGPKGPCKELYQEDETRKQPWSPWLDVVTLASEAPEWQEPFDLLRHYGQIAPGDYSLTIHWGGAVLDGMAVAHVQTDLRQRFQGREVVFLDRLSLDAELKFQVILPTGMDMKAYATFNGNPCDSAKADDLLSRFPTSTYAGYFLGLGQGFDIKLNSKPEFVVRTLWQENYLRKNPQATIHRRVEKKGNVEEVLGQVPMAEQLQSQRARIETFLKIHPDFARREILEMSRAYQSLALGDRSTACLALEWVSKNAPSQQWRDQADAILGELARSDKATSSATPQVKGKS